jgi:hypothetical protein
MSNLYKMKRPFTLLACAVMIPLAAFSQVNLNNGLTAYYPFNGNFQDMSGNNNHGTAIGGTSFGTDHVGNTNAAAYFDGIDDWVSIASAASITASDKMTISFRFSTANTQDQQVLISKTDHPNVGSYVYNQQMQIGIYCSPSIGNDNIFFATDHDGTCNMSSGFSYLFNNQLNALPPVLNTWYCVVMTFDSGQKKIFLDGALNAQSTISSTNIDSCNGGMLKFGVWWQNDLLHYKGLLDEVRFYKRVLNTQEIDSLCNLNSTTGITHVAGIANERTMNISPNPATDMVKVTVPADWNGYTVEVYDQVGQKVYQSIPGQNVSYIDCDRFPAGMYLIKCLHNGQVCTDKFLKQ